MSIVAVTANFPKKADEKPSHRRWISVLRLDFDGGRTEPFSVAQRRWRIDVSIDRSAELWKLLSDTWEK
jgi:hypothetical protein